MKKVWNSLFCLAFSTMLFGGLSACSDDDSNTADGPDYKESMFEAAMTPYIDNTVVSTYKGMADNAILMADACNDIADAFANGTLTNTDLIKNAGIHWNNCRDNWEKSEAFLYGAAADYNIDPHIDSWPLDKNAMEQLLNNIRAGQAWDVANLGYGLLGFHAVEYMLFELSADGNTSMPHNINYTAEELVYLCAVAEDLRDQCILLEAAWAGMENITDEKAVLLEAAELEPSFNYGWSMKNAGKGGSRYKNFQEAAEDMIQGCIDIADEVGNTKIGRPANGSSQADKNYIESPYSLNSINDFVGNIISIKNAYEGSKVGDASISDYIKSVNSELDSKVKELIQTCIAAIQKIPEPFAKSASGVDADNAVKIVGTDLVNVLEDVMSELSKY